MGVTSGVWPRVGQTRLHPEQAPQEAGVEGGEGKGESNCLSRVRCPPSGKLDRSTSRIYKNIPLEKRTKDINRHFTVDEI